MTQSTIDYMRADSPVAGHSAEWHFFRSYVGTALWSSAGDDDDSEGPVITSEHDISDTAPAALEAMLQDCAAFYAAHAEPIHCDGAPLSNEDGSIAAREAGIAGHDFWLTRCGHGAGFWDGDWPEPAASVLDAAARKAGNVDLYVGDDWLIYA